MKFNQKETHLSTQAQSLQRCADETSARAMFIPRYAANSEMARLTEDPLLQG